MIANLGCQLEYTWHQQKPKELGTPVKFLDWIISGGKISLKPRSSEVGRLPLPYSTPQYEPFEGGQTHLKPGPHLSGSLCKRTLKKDIFAFWMLDLCPPLTGLPILLQMYSLADNRIKFFGVPVYTEVS